MIIRGNIVDIFNRSIFKGEIEVSDGKLLIFVLVNMM